VRRLVEGHFGRYGVSSRPGEGALFWFELPAAEHSSSTEMPAVDPAPHQERPAN
jgi:light-regulated signal transduction histidine kinase (bacteriophytochrome)